MSRSCFHNHRRRSVLSDCSSSEWSLNVRIVSTSKPATSETSAAGNSRVDSGVNVSIAIAESGTYRSSRMKVLSSTSATLTYVAHQEESSAGKPLPSVLLNADVFVRRNGKWLVPTHMEATATDQGK